MKFIVGNDRNQIPLFLYTLEDAISPDHEIRPIERFVNSLSFAQMGFKLNFIECGRNIEMMWLTKGLKPDHNTIVPRTTSKFDLA